MFCATIAILNHIVSGCIGIIYLDDIHKCERPRSRPKSRAGTLALYNSDTTGLDIICKFLTPSP